MAKNEEKKPAGADQAQSPAEQQGQQTEPDEVTLRALHDMIMLVGDQVAGLALRVAELEAKSATLGEPITAVLDTTALPQIEFDEAWLEGLVYRDSKEVTPEDGQNGRKVKRFQPFERPAEMNDVLSWKVDGDTVAIVLADGSKHQLER